jgi:nitrogen fixation protein
MQLVECSHDKVLLENGWSVEMCNISPGHGISPCYIEAFALERFLM